jgi:hypothetical protein
MVGCECITLGSDYRFDMRDSDPVAGTDVLVGRPEEDLDGIRGRTAAILLKS